MHSDAGHAGISAVGSSDPRHGTPWQIWALEPGLLPADGCTPTASSRAPCDSCDVEASWDPSAEEISVGSFPAADFALKTGAALRTARDQGQALEKSLTKAQGLLESHDPEQSRSAASQGRPCKPGAAETLPRETGTEPGQLQEGQGRLVKQGESMELQEVFEDVAIADSCAVEAPWDSSAEEISVVSFPAADTALETAEAALVCAREAR
ncbi:hypothetical protein Y1Q_0020502 [Alligator mississippiensis]|uniref:Uncharacterized protein n=1 Tax=Alligator mississippiensis TaxID=8496 RepID=A0A151M654_ALLMI|nr:hypothetical protein Y1Q_0020502 [Alligator mississippiensis]